MLGKSRSDTCGAQRHFFIGETGDTPVGREIDENGVALIKQLLQSRFGIGFPVGGLGPAAPVSLPGENQGNDDGSHRNQSGEWCFAQFEQPEGKECQDNTRDHRDDRVASRLPAQYPEEPCTTQVKGEGEELLERYHPGAGAG